MNRFGKYCLVALTVLAFGVFGPANLHADQNNDSQKVIDAFVEYVQNSDVANKTEIVETVKAAAADEYLRSEAITSGLTKMVPEYQAALETAAEMKADEAIKALQPFIDSDNDFLAADASFFLARAYMSDQQFEKATPMLESLVNDHKDHSLFSGNAQYFQGLAYSGTLQPKKAIDAFVEFLRNNEDAPERMRVSAWRKIQELQSIQPGKMNDVHQHMSYSKRRLEIENTDKQTQKEQDEIVKMLATLIKDQEKKECSNCKGSKNCNKPSDSQSQAQNQSQSQGKSSTGGQSKQSNGVAQRRFSNGPASPWSKLRDRSRDPANSAIKNKLPPRYRKMIEKSHERINKDISGNNSNR